MSEIVRTPQDYPLKTFLKGDGAQFFIAHEQLFPIADPEQRASFSDQYVSVPSLPKTFEGRKVWKKYLSDVTNQKHCGGCYAFASTSALADRYNIQTLNKNGRLNLSAARLILCNVVGSTFLVTELEQESLDAIVSKYGCEGNTLAEAWSYLYRVGTNTVKCFPNQIEGRVCKNNSGPFYDECHDGSPARFYRSSGIFSVPGTLAQRGSAIEICKHIYKFGPITTSMAIYEDFYTFDAKNTIYKWDGKSARLNGHSVVLDGWGVEKGIEYWWVRSSWGKEWGDKGYFRIIRGQNHCQIEENVIVGMPDLGFNIPFFREILVTNEKLFRQRKMEDTAYLPDGGLDKLSGYTRRILSFEENQKLLDNLDFSEINWKTYFAGEIGSSSSKIRRWIKILSTIIVVIILILL